jgi:hypothetical protein
MNINPGRAKRLDRGLLKHDFGLSGVVRWRLAACVHSCRRTSRFANAVVAPCSRYLPPVLRGQGGSTILHRENVGLGQSAIPTLLQRARQGWGNRLKEFFQATLGPDPKSGTTMSQPPYNMMSQSVQRLHWRTESC